MYTVYTRNALTGSGHFTGTFETMEQAEGYAKLQATRSRKFCTFEVWTGTPKSWRDKTDVQFVGEA